MATRATEIGAAALGGGVLAYLVFAGIVSFGGSLPLLGPVAWLSIALCAAGIGGLAFVTRRTLAAGRVVEPKTAVTRLLLGKTSLLAGSFLGAAYLGLVLVASGSWPAPLAQERVVHGGLAALACLAWAVCGWLLERACRIPPDDTPDADDSGPEFDEGPGVA